MQRWDTQRNDQRCLECGSHVTPQFGRVYGDEDDRAHRCTTCDTNKRLSDGSATGKHVPLPDPLNDPGRFNSTLEDLPSQVRSAIQSRAVATDGGEER
ncbi:hypothetical protein EL22_25370 [Halostagnicola sp. A56]|nr:hypothetical protein EL22_25370 [Halostagnicola sp. A56]